MTNMLVGRQVRNTKMAFADKLLYGGLIEDGIVVLKNGAVMAGFYYIPPDGGSKSNLERNNLKDRLNRELIQLKKGWAAWFEAVRLPSRSYPLPNESFFPDPVSRAIDDERRMQFEGDGEHFETVYAVILVFEPGGKKASKIKEMMYVDEGTQSSVSYSMQVLRNFKADVDKFESGVGSFIKMTRMRGYEHIDEYGYSHKRDELLTFLQSALLGEPVALNVPPVPMFLDGILGGGDFYPGITPKYANKFIATVAVDGYPAESYPGIFDHLNSLGMPYRWSTRFICMDTAQSTKEFKKEYGQWSQKARGFLADLTGKEPKNPNQHAVEMAQQANQALSEVDSQRAKFGYYTNVVVLMDEDRHILELRADYVREVIKSLGFSARVEEENTMEAFMGSLPGHTRPNLRRPLISTENLADFMPIHGEWPGLTNNPSHMFPPGSPALFYGKTPSSTPFRLNLHVKDVGHGMGFGPTGSGKSVLLGTTAVQFLRYQGATVFVFDNGASMRFLCEACGGNFYDMTLGKSGLGFAPLAQLDSDEDMVWAQDWCELLVQLQRAGLKPTITERGKIRQALLDLQKAPRNQRTLSDFTSAVQDVELRKVFEQYCEDGQYKTLLDSEEDNIGESNFNVFEIENFRKGAKEIVAPVLLYLFRQIDRRLRGQPALLILDEAWAILLDDMFREQLVEWLRTFRRKNCAVQLFTQSLPDALNSDVMSVLVDNCKTLFFLPNDSALKEGNEKVMGPADYYRACGLNETEIYNLSVMRPQKEYYYTSPEGNRIFELNLGPIAKAFITSSTKADLIRLDELKSQYGKAWPAQWLKEKGVEHDIQFVA